MIQYRSSTELFHSGSQLMASMREDAIKRRTSLMAIFISPPSVEMIVIKAQRNSDSEHYKDSQPTPPDDAVYQSKNHISRAGHKGNLKSRAPGMVPPSPKLASKALAPRGACKLSLTDQKRIIQRSSHERRT